MWFAMPTPQVLDSLDFLKSQCITAAARPNIELTRRGKNQLSGGELAKQVPL